MDEPFILISHPHTVALPASLPTVSAVSYTTSSKNDRRLGVVAAHVGCAVYDVADQTPLSSLTLGPTFSPVTPMVARSTPTTSAESIRIKSIRRTWIGVNAGEGAGQVWSWIEEERKDGSTEGEATKTVHDFDAPVIAIAAPRTLPSHLLLLSSTGSLSVATESGLTVVASLPAPSALPTQQILQVHPVTSSSFLPSTLTKLLPASNHRAHLVFILRSSAPSPSSPTMVEISKKKFKKTKRPSSAAIIDAADEEKTISTSGEAVEIEVVLVDTEVIDAGVTCVGIVSLGKVSVAGAQVVVSEAGFVTSVDSNGSMSSCRLAFPSLTTFPATYASLFSEYTPVELTTAHIKTLPLSHTTLSSTSSTGLSLLALHSSFVLLASVRPRSNTLPTPEDPPTKVIVLVWDVRLGAVVSEAKISVPSAALPSPETATSRTVRVALNRISNQLAGVVVAPLTNGGRAIVFVVPFTLPTSSVLAVVVGKQALTRKYLVVRGGIAEQAQKAEQLRHPRTSVAKGLLLDASEIARAELLKRLEVLLAPDAASTVETSKGGSAVVTLEVVAKADDLFEAFLVEERERWSEYHAKRAKVADEREKERRSAGVEAKELLEVGTKKYRLTMMKIEEAIAKAVKEGKKEGVSWRDVTAKRIKGVSDVYRFKYFEIRDVLEGGGITTVGAGKGEKEKPNGVKSVGRYEPMIPSTFVVALLRFCFPGYLNSGNDVRFAVSNKVWVHPTRMISYLLDQKLVGDSMIEGGVTRFLARASDWPNLTKALATMQDIPEATTVALLKLVILHSATVDVNAIESDSLPFSPPTLSSFLATFVEAPYTPSALRNALQSQLSALEGLPVLKILDGWLGWWSARGGGGGEAKKSEGVKAKRLPINPFTSLSIEDAMTSEQEEEFVPPSVEVILPLVQALLDAHFVTLLLQRQSHSLLRSLSSHIALHLAQSNSLSLLLGPLAIYARTRSENKAAARKLKMKSATMNTSGGGGGGGGRQATLSERMEKRVAAQEKHAAVGEYVIEKFWI